MAMAVRMPAAVETRRSPSKGSSVIRIMVMAAVMPAAAPRASAERMPAAGASSAVAWGGASDAASVISAVSVPTVMDASSGFGWIGVRGGCGSGRPALLLLRVRVALRLSGGGSVAAGALGASGGCGWAGGSRAAGTCTLE